MRAYGNGSICVVSKNANCVVDPISHVDTSNLKTAIMLCGNDNVGFGTNLNSEATASVSLIPVDNLQIVKSDHLIGKI